MLSFLDPVRDLTDWAVVLRMLLSAAAGGIIGLEREFRRRPAGFRTHILICLGACITTMTSQYLLLRMHYYTDITRLGAQVIAGIGFVGAGAIMVTRRHQVKGLPGCGFRPLLVWPLARGFMRAVSMPRFCC